MTTILLVEDDDAIRANVTRLLKLEGYDTTAAVNGTQGLALARELRPDVVITDISMPEMDGLQLLEAIRADASLAATPVLLLTALDDRANLRRGMSAGADDCLAKPFTRIELIQALSGLLRKKGRIGRTIGQAVQSSEEQLRRAFAESLVGRKALHRIGFEPAAGAVAQGATQACILFADVRDFTTIASRLAAPEVVELLAAWLERASAALAQQGGQHARFVGDGVTAVFEAVREGDGMAARRAVAAALGVAVAAHEFRSWLERRFPGRGLPPFTIGIGLDAGEITVWNAAEAPGKSVSVTGDAVNVAARLETAGKELGWTIVASRPVLQAAGEGLLTGGMTSLQARADGGFVDVAEVTGLAPGAHLEAIGAGEAAHLAAAWSAAVQANSEMTARAVKGALHARLSALRAHDFVPGEEPVRLKGYRLSRKIGSGGMTHVYLAQRETDGLAVVLKVLDATGKATTEHLSRFIQEYAILCGIDHPNVVRIHDQGFTDDHAYIAMEYFPSGDLRAELAAGMTQQRALDIVAQLARALGAIHACGVIHRDLKPENVMRREDGTVALADFGIAKSTRPSDLPGFAQTRDGDVVGTPYYVSPEQVAGQGVTPRSDFYSLGVMLHEMLTGDRPYRAESLDLLLARHLNAPIPRLPAEHEGLQPLLECLMAKSPERRIASAEALLAGLEQLGFHRTLPGRRG